jgi:hypothetical protein
MMMKVAAISALVALVTADIELTRTVRYHPARILDTTLVVWAKVCSK